MSKIFLNWSNKIHELNLISEIEDLNRDEVLTQFSNIDSSENSVHNIEAFEIEKKKKKTLIRDLPDDSIDTEADPKIDIPEEISPTSTRNLETVFHKLGSIIEKSMEKQSHKELYYE